MIFELDSRHEVSLREVVAVQLLSPGHVAVFPASLNGLKPSFISDTYLWANAGVLADFS